MSLLGIDVGTSGCKSAVFATDGRLLASAYEEYDIRRPRPGWAELDSLEVWTKVQCTVARAVAEARGDPVRALAVSSLGEAMVPVSADGHLLGPSILNFDARGDEYISGLASAIDPAELYRISGNTLGNHFGLTKLMWLRDHAAATYREAHRFLLWGSLVGHLLGAEPAVDPSLANRTLLFDLERGEWSHDLAALAGINHTKLPMVAPAGTVIGRVRPRLAASLGLDPDVAIVVGAHDQCANAVGAGAVTEGRAMYGMGTFLCVVAPFGRRSAPSAMASQGLNTEHHAAPGLYVTFIYNHGGSLLKWFRDTCTRSEYERSLAEGRSAYPQLLAERCPLVRVG
jgi:xylulokinase